jgi:AraC-like DNA-binding protein
LVDLAFPRGIYYIVVKYLNIYRINISIELMYNEKLTLNQIGGACGFETPSYFAKIFKRELKVTPSKYRESFILYKKNGTNK